MSTEKRKKLRVSVARPVVIVLSSGKKVHAFTVNISEIGMGIMTHIEAEKGAKLGFRFSIQVGKKAEEFDIKGTIMHCHVRADKYYSGVAFLGLSDEQKKNLRKFVLDLRGSRAGS